MKKVIFIVLFVLLAFCTKKQKSELIIFHAGSLSKPFSEMEALFESQNPNVNVIRESSGSKLAARKVAELKKPADIVAVSDYSVIPEVLYPEYADWTIYFAKNSMVIVYTGRSKFSSEINSQNWTETLLRNNVEVGHSDPILDPCGYRALLVMKLAEEYYKLSGFYNKLRNKIPQKNIRPKETDLVALAEAGEIDYHFNYKSVAEQHNLKYIDLPNEINLSNLKLKEYYKNAKIELKDKEGKIIKVNGEPILYGITILKDAPHKNIAEEFVQLLLSDAGRKILIKNFQEPLNPPLTDNRELLPEKLKSRVTK
jgi:molybdate/tungstate transport system substrate-binding protein